jgi:hypothetical protein
MVKITITLEDSEHLKLLEIQLDRKKKKIEPTAINKIAGEILTEALKNQTPTK